MRTISNNKRSSKLVVILHGLKSNIDSTLVRSIFNELKDLDKRVILVEFSYVRKKKQPDPDQIVEARELVDFLKAQKYKELTVVGHSNGGFVALVAKTLKLKIDCLVLLGISSVEKKETAQIIAGILKEIPAVIIIQGEKDEYLPASAVRDFLTTFKLKGELVVVAGDHHFRGYEHVVAKKVRVALN